jgi:hypothetical protein
MKRLVFVLVACSHPKPAAPPPAPPSKCARVADHLLSLMSPTAQEPTETLDKMRTIFDTRCREDAWSPAAQDCFLAATSLADAAERCESLLTPEQTQSFGNAIQSAASQQKTP